MSIPFIAVEGPIGVGKTTLTKAISEVYRFQRLHEIVEENPFLSKFYEDIDAWSFQTEMFFLCNRYKQLTDVKFAQNGKSSPVVADYHIFKNLIFAKRTLQSIEYEKYEKIYHILMDDMPMPNIIIYLHASQTTLMKRIAKRDRDFEKNLEQDYLNQLAADYDTFIDTFEKENPHIPVLRFNGDDLDFVNRASDLSIILEEVKNVLPKGVNKK